MKKFNPTSAVVASLFAIAVFSITSPVSASEYPTFNTFTLSGKFYDATNTGAVSSTSYIQTGFADMISCGDTLTSLRNLSIPVVGVKSGFVGICTKTVNVPLIVVPLIN